MDGAQLSARDSRRGTLSGCLGHVGSVPLQAGPAARAVSSGLAIADSANCERAARVVGEQQPAAAARSVRDVVEHGFRIVAGIAARFAADDDMPRGGAAFVLDSE